MPLDRRGAAQLGLLILIVPAQYLLTTYYGASSSQKDYNLKRLYESINYYKANYLSWDTWTAWCVDVYTKAKSVIIAYRNDIGEDGESVAVEVISYRNSKGYFASSTDPRSPRPLNVKYRVGQVVRHKRDNYRGVIIGWDAVAKQWRHSPAYLILVDYRDHPETESVYVVEDDLELLQRTMVIHPKLDDYFDGFDGIRYLPRQRLKSVYPHD